MTYKIQFHRKASKSLQSLNKNDFRRIRKIVNSLESDPRSKGKKLTDSKFPDVYRVRSGDYRIVYQVKDKEVIVLVLRILDRKDVYRQLKQAGIL